MKNFFWPIFENLMKIVVSHEFYVSKFTLLMTKKNEIFFGKFLKNILKLIYFHRAHPTSTKTLKNLHSFPFATMLFIKFQT